MGIGVFKPLKRMGGWLSPAGRRLREGAEHVAQALLDFFIEDLCALCDRRAPRSIETGDGPRARLTRDRVWVRCLGLRLANHPVCRMCADELEQARAVGLLGEALADGSVRTIEGERFGATATGVVSASPRVIFVHAPFMTNDKLLEIVHLIKFKRYHALIPSVAGAIVTSPGVERVLTTGDMLVPVPMEKSERRQRRLNHAAVIARCLSGQMAIPLMANALVKTRRTERQSQTPQPFKAANVRGAFRAEVALVAGKHVFLVDDLVTTGATAAACAGALVQAGAASVGVLAVGRAL